MPVTPFGVEVGILYRLTGPDGTSVSFNDITQSDFVGYTEEVTGLDGPDTRESADLIVEGDGGYHGNFYHGRRPIVLSGIIDPNSFGAARNSMVSNLLRATNAMRQDAVLSWTPTGGDPVAVRVRRQQPPRVTGGRVKSFQVALVAADPRVYGTAERTLARTSEASPSGWWGHTGDGDYDAGAIYLGPAYHLPLGNPGGLTNRSTTGWAGNGTANGGMSIGSFSPGPLVRGENFATDFDGTNDYISTDYATRRNMIPNPRFANDTALWSVAAFYHLNAGATITRTTPSLEQTGPYIAAVVTTAAAAGQGASIPFTGQTFKAGVQYTFRARVYGFGSMALQLFFGQATADHSTTLFTNNWSGWQDVSVSWTPAADTTAAHAGIRTSLSSGPQAGTFYFTGCIAERGSSPGPYFDGSGKLNGSSYGTWVANTEGECGWLGTAHQSASDKGCFANGTVRTFMGWIKRPISGADYDIVFAGDGPSTCRFYLTESSNSAMFEAAGSAAMVYWAAGMNVTSWVHFAVVFDEPGNLASLYVNGTLISSQALSDQYPEGAGNLKLGSCWAGVAYPFKGQMRSFSVFPRGLSANEIRWLYEEGARAMAFNRGNADTPAVMRITGPITDPVIWNMHWTAGTLFTLTGTISAGNWWEIDTSDGTIVDQAGANQYGKMVFASSEWKDLKPGVNDLRLVGTGTTGATELKLTWKDAWI